MFLNVLHALEIGITETLLKLSILILLVLVVGFFVAAELSLVAASRDQIAHWTKQTADPSKAKTALLVQTAQSNLQHYFSITQTGTTAGSLLLGWLGEGATVHWIEPWIGWLPLGKLPVQITAHAIAIASAFFLITYVEILLGELVPKVLAANAPEETALLLIRPLRMCDWLLSPFLFLLNSNVRFLTGWLTRKAPPVDSPIADCNLVSYAIELQVPLLKGDLGGSSNHASEHKSV